VNAGQVSAIKLPFPAPRRFYLTVMKATGKDTQGLEYPTLVLSYVGLKSKSTPDENLLADINAVQVNFDPGEQESEAGIELLCFLTPRKELLDFADARYLYASVNPVQANKIIQKMHDFGRWALVINTDAYMFRSLIDDDSGEVMESVLEFRMLN
jgi:hypothetical protein